MQTKVNAESPKVFQKRRRLMGEKYDALIRDERRKVDQYTSDIKECCVGMSHEGAKELLYVLTSFMNGMGE